MSYNKVNFNSILSDIFGKLKRSFFNTINFCIDTFLILLQQLIPRDRETASIGIVRLDVIGDFFLWSYYIDSLLNHYQKNGNGKIVLIAESSWAAFAKQYYSFYEVISVNRAKFRMNPLYRIEVLTYLSKYTFKTILKPTYTRELSLEESIVRCMRGENKIGYLPINQGNEWRFWERLGEFWFTSKIKGDPDILSEIEKNAFLFDYLKINKKEIKLGSFIIEDSVSMNIGKYFIIFPGASVGRKKWGDHNFAMLINSILASTDLSCVICGSNADIQTADTILSFVKYPNRVYNKAGKTSLSDLLTIIKNAEILIGNDTSGIHIAAAVGTRSVCILGGGHFGRFLPYPTYLEPKEYQPIVVYENMPCFGCGWKCKYTLSYNDPVPCITMISVESVYAKFKLSYEPALKQ